MKPPGSPEEVAPSGPAAVVVDAAVGAQDYAIREAFAALGAGGKVTMPLANAPWGPYFGMCVDRFGVHWMVSLPHPV